ncbi:MAG: GlsB/YeaQ/YmgE family stress response membrane protein [Hyphomicrobium sp.]|jgi:uncharacterized membrane protein YeaQ/YmgE (transglycosylase-associated protein family)
MESYAPYAPWIVMVLNGLVAGWLASLLLGGGGIIRDIFVGIIGSFVGGALVQAGLLKLPFLLDMPWVHQILVSTVGALLIIVIARIIGR